MRAVGGNRHVFINHSARSVGRQQTERRGDGEGLHALALVHRRLGGGAVEPSALARAHLYG